MSRNRLVAAALLTLLFALSESAGVLAQIPTNRVADPERIIQQFDQNGDGKLSHTEFPRPAFNRLDADGDGFVTIEELKGAMANRRSSAKTMPPTRAVPGLYFVDAHSQMDENVDETRVISLMDHGGVYRTILSSHLGRPWEDIVTFGERSNGRIVPAVRIKGGGYQSGNPEKFYEALAAQLADARFLAMAEVLVYHDAKGRFVAVKTRLDDPEVTAAFAAVEKKGWPFILHLEFAYMSAADRKAYMEQLHTFLTEHGKSPVVLMYKGFLKADGVRQLIGAHSNVLFMTCGSLPPNPILRAHPELSILAGQGSNAKLAPQWRALFVDHPDRFVFCLDNVFGPQWTPRPYLAQMMAWWRVLAVLPDAAAHAIAHGNAERLWHLSAKPAEIAMIPPWESQARLGPVTGRAKTEMPARR